jgi:hypothetical protein
VKQNLRRGLKRPDKQPDPGHDREHDQAGICTGRRASGPGFEQAFHLGLKNNDAIILPLAQSDDLPTFLFER